MRGMLSLPPTFLFLSACFLGAMMLTPLVVIEEVLDS